MLLDFQPAYFRLALLGNLGGGFHCTYSTQKGSKLIPNHSFCKEMSNVDTMHVKLDTRGSYIMQILVNEFDKCQNLFDFNILFLNSFQLIARKCKFSSVSPEKIMRYSYKG